MRLTPWKSLLLACILAAGASCMAPGTNPLPVGGTLDAVRPSEKSSSEKSSPEKSLPEKSLDDATPDSSSSFQPQPQLPSQSPGAFDASSPKPTAARAPTDVIVADNRSGGFPSGNRAPVVDLDNNWMCLNARYQSLCREGYEKRVRIQLKGKISSSDGDPTTCIYGGKRALRVIYPTGEGGPASLKFVDIPVSEDGQVEAVFSTSDPESMEYYLVPKKDFVEEQSCANESCIDADQNGVQDADRCVVITLALLCDHDAPPPKLGRTVIEVHPHNQGPLTECQQFFIKEAMPIEKMILSPALKK